MDPQIIDKLIENAIQNPVQGCIAVVLVCGSIVALYKLGLRAKDFEPIYRECQP